MKNKKLSVVLLLVVVGILGVCLFIPTDSTSHPLATGDGETVASSNNEEIFTYADCDCEDPRDDPDTISCSYTILTDKLTYLPSETVKIRGYSFVPQSKVNLTIERPCTCGEHKSHFDVFEEIPVDSIGQFEIDYQHYGAPGLYNITCTDGVETAGNSFIVSPYVIWTDKPKYVADETVVISGTGFNTESEINVTVIAPDSTILKWSAMTDNVGDFTTTYIATGVNGRYAILATDGDHTAGTSFIDPYPPISNAWIQVSPHFGYTGLPVSVSGWGFEGDGIVYIVGSQENLILTTFTAENGHFATTFIVPDITPDYYMICASSSVYIEQTICVPGVCLDCYDVCVIELFGHCLWWQTVCVPVYCDWCYDAGYYEYFDDCIDFPFAIYPNPITDQSPPSTTVELEGTEGCGDWFTSEVLFSLDATDEITDVEKTAYRFGESGPWIEYTEPVHIDFEGVFDIYYNSTDIAGNVEEPNHVTVKIDWTEPETTATPTGTMGMNGWYTSPVTIYLDATDLDENDQNPGSGIMKTWYRVNGGPYLQYTNPLVLPGDGVYTVNFYSVDMACNTEEYPGTCQVKIDTTAPHTTALPIGTLGNDGWYKSAVTVDLQALDPLPGAGFSHTMCKVDSGVWEPFIAPIHIGNEGGHTIGFYSIDLAGNEESKTYMTIKIDFSKPTTLLIPDGTPGLDGWYTTPVTVYLDASDPIPGSGVLATYYYIDSGPTTLYGSSFCLQEGIWTVHFYSVDKAGNVEQAKSETIRVDITPPVTMLILGSHYTDGNSIFVTSSTSFSFEIVEETSGVASTWYTIDNGALTEYSGTFTLNGPDGAYALTFYSKDKAGNTELQKPATVILVSLDVMSYMTDSEFNPISGFDVVMTKDKASGGYKLVATNPGQFYYNIEITNNWPIQVDTLIVTAEIPADFVLKGAMPIHIYLDNMDITGSCEIDGLTVTVTDVPAGGLVYIAIHLDYGLKGNLYDSLESFVLTSYQFKAFVAGTSGELAPPGDSLEGNYMKTSSLIAHQKKTTAIAGYILNNDGTPVVGVTVMLTNAVGDSYNAVTDENGFYYFIGIEVGEYTISVIVDSQEYSEAATTIKNELTEVIIIVE